MVMSVAFMDLKGKNMPGRQFVHVMLCALGLIPSLSWFSKHHWEQPPSTAWEPPQPSEVESQHSNLTAMIHWMVFYFSISFQMEEYYWVFVDKYFSFDFVVLRIKSRTCHLQGILSTADPKHQPLCAFNLQYSLINLVIAPSIKMKIVCINIQNIEYVCFHMGYVWSQGFNSLIYLLELVLIFLCLMVFCISSQIKVGCCFS